MLPTIENASLRQLLLVFLRRWRLFTFGCALSLGVAAVYTLTSPKLYRPQATLEIRPETSVMTMDPLDPALMASRSMWDNYYRTQEQILRSPTLLEAAIKALPEAIRRRYEGLENPGRTLASRVEVESVRSSFILKLGVLDEDPAIAAQIANTIVSVFIDDASRRLRDVKSGTIEALSKEALPSARQKVDAADKATQLFRDESGYADYSEQYESLLAARRKVTERLTEARLRRLRLQAEVQSLRAYGSDGLSGIFNPAFHATRILEPLIQRRQQILDELTRQSNALRERHPRLMELAAQQALVEQNIREAIGGVLLSYETDLETVEREEKALGEELKRLEGDMGAAGRKLTEYRRLEAELTAAKELYNAYLKRYGETSATSGAGLGSVRVIDVARVPHIPHKPSVTSNLWMGAALGVLLGMLLMLIAEQLDDRVLSTTEIEAFIGLDVLGRLPRLTIAQSADKEKPACLTDVSPIRELEAFRAMRAQVATRLERTGGKVLAVVSPMRGEGKSTVAINLARVLAMEGRRVLVFDADMRRPSIKPCFAAGEAPGLEQVLKGEVTFEQALEASKIPGVDVIGARSGSDGAAELASSPRFEAALRSAREAYDIVVLDCPPVNQVSESSLIARRADAALLVVRAEQTGRGSAAVAKRRLQELDVKLLGAVLNSVRGSPSGYGYYYYYAQGKGREAEA